MMLTQVYVLFLFQIYFVVSDTKVFETLTLNALPLYLLNLKTGELKSGASNDKNPRKTPYTWKAKLAVSSGFAPSCGPNKVFNVDTKTNTKQVVATPKNDTRNLVAPTRVTQNVVAPKMETQIVITPKKETQNVVAPKILTQNLVSPKVLNENVTAVNPENTEAIQSNQPGPSTGFVAPNTPNNLFITVPHNNLYTNNIPMNVRSPSLVVDRGNVIPFITTANTEQRKNIYHNVALENLARQNVSVRTFNNVVVQNNLNPTINNTDNIQNSMPKIISIHSSALTQQVNQSVSSVPAQNVASNVMAPDRLIITPIGNQVDPNAGIFPPMQESENNQMLPGDISNLRYLPSEIIDLASDED